MTSNYPRAFGESTHGHEMTDEDVPVDSTGSTRRSVLKAAGVVGAGALLPVAATAEGFTETAPDGSGWTQIHGNAANNRHLPDGSAPVADPTVRWEKTDDRITEGVAITADSVYVGGKALTARDLESGEQQWSYSPDEPDRYDDDEGETSDFGDPAVANGTVYAPLGWGVADAIPQWDVIAAVDAETGEEQWWFDADGYFEYSDPVVTGDTVYTVGQAESGDGRALFAVGTDGSLRWQETLTDAASVPAVADGMVYVATADGALALDAATGEEVWQTSLGRDDNTDRAVVADGRCYVVRLDEDGPMLVALDAATGEERWRTEWSADGPYPVVGAADADRVYVHLNGEGSPDVAALDATSGEVDWEFDFEYQPPPDYSTENLGLVGGYLYVGSLCLDPADGSVVWKRPVEVGTFTTATFGGAAHGVVALVGGPVTILEGPTDDGTTTTTETTETTTETTETTTETTTTESTTTETPTETTTESTTTTDSSDEC